MNNTENKPQTEIVDIIREVDVKFDGSWQPREDETTLALQKQTLQSGIKEHEWENIKDGALSILLKCVPPNSVPRQETGLVVGYVQSGKTLSFTTVAALARDNNYQIVIVIAGTSINLRDQSTKRLEDDLDLLTRSDRNWHHFKSEEFKVGDHTKIEDVLTDWQDPSVPEWDRQTVLITAMKNHRHLEKLASVLSQLELSGVPTLVIDDEADQASLNTKVQKGETSTTYERILSLREYLPHHTFLQYTATPQAPLLINLIDMLSPNFVKVLSPGEAYKGGKAFFLDGLSQIRTIPESDIPTKDLPLEAPPDSLLEAMRIFFLGVSAGIILDRSEGNRSMMVHPSRETIGHSQYYHWIETVRKNWLETLDLNEDERDYQDLLEGFKNSYQDLQSSVPNLPSFEALSSRLLYAIRKTQLHEINSTSGKTPGVPWHNAYAHILVGGQAMDRGFTVEGLTVTYMPRGKGMGNADTIQQRARFFGYKQNYFGYCRVFLENSVRDAYRDYIIHEEDIRERLLAYDETGESLDGWKRTFFLDRSLKPTRHNVLGIDYSQRNLSDQWHTPKAPHDPVEAVNENRVIVQQFMKKWLSQEYTKNTKQNESWHPVAANIPLKDVYEELLVPLQFKRWVDTDKFTQVHLQIAVYLDSHPDELCTVYCIKNDDNPRTRTLDGNGEIPELFQGPSSRTGEQYPGDRQIKAVKGVTIQIHNVTIIHPNGKTVPDIPAVAVWLPKNMSQDLLVQHQGGTDIGS